eukprot:COSAG05_NODE_5095_length_1264_cov_1.761373_1_plen_253_part_00
MAAAARGVFTGGPQLAAPGLVERRRAVNPLLAARRGMFIQTQTTPNPSALMFLPGQDVMGEDGGTATFGNARESMASPLAKLLFQTNSVTNVFFGSDYISITTDGSVDWDLLKPDIFACIMDFYQSGQPLILDGASVGTADTEILDTDDEVVAMIKELLDTRIRPSVQEDGGDIKYRGFEEEDGIVLLQLQGACAGCPSSQATLKGGIEGMMKHYIPEVQGVREVMDEMESSPQPLSFTPQPVPEGVKSSPS